MGKHLVYLPLSGNVITRALAATVLSAVLLAPAQLRAQAAATPAAGAEAWKATVAAAQKEQRVVLYSAAANSLLSRLKADFDKANPGITLEISRFIRTRQCRGCPQGAAAPRRCNSHFAERSVNWHRAL